MNKAFVKEPDALVDRCPRCGSPGQAVHRETLLTHLSAEECEQLADSACFCPLPTCSVAYFDAFERTVPVSSLLHPVYPKDPDAAICPCFGFTCDEIDQDIREGVVTRTRALVEKAKSADAGVQCVVKAANGRSCIADVQKYYMQHRGG